MITVACVLWGNWAGGHGERYVHAMKAAVEKYLPEADRFVCLTDRDIEGIERAGLKTAGLKGCLPKMGLYHPDNGFEGRVIAFDLDDIPVGSLDVLLDYDGPLCCIEDPWEPGAAGGGTVSFDAGCEDLAERLLMPCLMRPNDVAKICHGSERQWLRYQGITTFWPPGIFADAKPQGHGKLVDEVPAGAAVMHCHGQPRPHTSDALWALNHFEGF